MPRATSPPTAGRVAGPRESRTGTGEVPGARRRARRDGRGQRAGGDLSGAEGRLAEAAARDGDALAIRERLAAGDPRNTQGQRDLIVSNVELAEIAASAGERGEARRRYTAALAGARELAATGRLAPVDRWIPAGLERLLAELEGSTTE